MAHMDLPAEVRVTLGDYTVTHEDRIEWVMDYFVEQGQSIPTFAVSRHSLCMMVRRTRARAALRGELPWVYLMLMTSAGPVRVYADNRVEPFPMDIRAIRDDTVAVYAVPPPRQDPKTVDGPYEALMTLAEGLMEVAAKFRT